MERELGTTVATAKPRDEMKDLFLLIIRRSAQLFPRIDEIPAVPAECPHYLTTSSQRRLSSCTEEGGESWYTSSGIELNNGSVWSDEQWRGHTRTEKD